MKPHIRLKVKRTGLPPFDLTDAELAILKAELEQIAKQIKVKTARYKAPLSRCPCDIFYGNVA